MNRKFTNSPLFILFLRIFGTKMCGCAYSDEYNTVLEGYTFRNIFYITAIREVKPS